MVVLVLGASGLIGNRLVRTLSTDFEVFGSTRMSKIEDSWLNQLLIKDRWLLNVFASNFPDLEIKLLSIKPDVIVNCLGVTKQRLNPVDIQESIVANALLPHELSKFCNGHGIRLIQLSTDCVFSGKKGNYKETDEPDPIDIYGRTKAIGELSNDRDLTIRTSFVGREIHSFTNLFEWAIRNRNSKVVGYTNVIYSGLTTEALSTIIKLIIAEHKELSGLWHVGSQPIRKFDLLSSLNKVLSLGVDIEPDGSKICDRSLNTDAFQSETLIKMPIWPEMLRDFAQDQVWYDLLKTSEVRVS